MKEEFTPKNCVVKISKILEEMDAHDYPWAMYYLGRLFEWMQSFDEDLPYNKASNNEISYWRNRYLNSIFPLNQRARMHFLSMPSETFLLRDAEEHYKKICDGFEKEESTQK